MQSWSSPDALAKCNQTLDEEVNRQMDEQYSEHFYQDGQLGKEEGIVLSIPHVAEVPNLPSKLEIQHACVCVCVRACVRACMYVYVYVSVLEPLVGVLSVRYNGMIVPYLNMQIRGAIWVSRFCFY